MAFSGLGLALSIGCHCSGAGCVRWVALGDCLASYTTCHWLLIGFCALQDRLYMKCHLLCVLGAKGGYLPWAAEQASGCRL